MAAFSPDIDVSSNRPGGASIPAWHGIPTSLRQQSPAQQQLRPYNEAAVPESAGSCASGHLAAATPLAQHGGQGAEASDGDDDEALCRASPAAAQGRELDLGQFASTPNPLYDASVSDACRDESGARRDVEHGDCAADVGPEEVRVRCASVPFQLMDTC